MPSGEEDAHHDAPKIALTWKDSATKARAGELTRAESVKLLRELFSCRSCPPMGAKRVSPQKTSRGSFAVIKPEKRVIWANKFAVTTTNEEPNNWLSTMT
jgi:hypothetical protein